MLIQCWMGRREHNWFWVILDEDHVYRQKADKCRDCSFTGCTVYPFLEPHMHSTSPYLSPRKICPLRRWGRSKNTNSPWPSSVSFPGETSWGTTSPSRFKTSDLFMQIWSFFLLGGEGGIMSAFLGICKLTCDGEYFQTLDLHCLFSTAPHVSVREVGSSELLPLLDPKNREN